jgi:CRP/FNR family transcriptional regulator, cyclic AMP receptor protein
MNEEILEKLKLIPFFTEIKDNDGYMRQLLGIITTKKVSKGEYIIKEGELGAEMYIPYNGEVEIRKKTRAGDDYTVIIERAEKNISFGEMALIDDERRSATVIAVADTTLLVITKKDFLALGDTHPMICLPITRAISRILASRLRKTTQDMLTIFDALVNEIRG